MTSFLSSLFRGWRAALLLVAIACASPGRAAAACGDHVVILNADGSAHAHSHTAPDTTDAPAPPCSGPHCSRAPDRPSPAPAPVPPSGPNGKEATTSLESAEDADTLRSFAVESTSSDPIRRPLDIFHPPRLG